MFKKGQAAMEFLMTYGWAILVVLAAIGALAYFGVLDTASMLPERCAFPAGIDCIGKAVVSANDNTIDFVLQNSNGAAITAVAGTATTSDDCANGNSTVCDASAGACTPGSSNISIANNGKVRYRITCDSITAGRFKSDIGVQYLDSNTGLTLSASGSIRGKAN